ncbi:hypothetical protein GJ496_006739 [Pomphorhynchus laevis]|nr:hypothetical protein GJ496_006739 [Pomphorhynchus laevis]
MPRKYCCSIHATSLKKEPDCKEIGLQGRMIFEQFVLYRAVTEGVDLAAAKTFIETDLANKAYDSCEIKKVAQALRVIGDQLDRNERLQGLITRVPINSPYDTFKAVAAEIFADGTFNWGRIVTLFYFAYKLLLQALSKVSLVRIVIEWTSRFVVEFVAPWIVEKGGWVNAMSKNIRSINSGMLTVFLSGMLAAYTLLWLQQK